MESVIQSRKYGSITVLALAALVAPAVAFLISYLVGFYAVGIPAPHPSYTPPNLATYLLDAAARVLFGLSLYFTLRSAVDDRAHLKTTVTVLWLAAYALSLIWLPVFILWRNALGGFIILAMIAAFTTAQFIINLKLSIPAALLTLPYWAFVLFYGYLNLMIML